MVADWALLALAAKAVAERRTAQVKVSSLRPSALLSLRVVKNMPLLEAALGTPSNANSDRLVAPS